MKNFNLLLNILLLTVFTSYSIFAQKKAMTPEVYKIWNRIDNERISDDGRFISYTLKKETGDPIMKLYETKTGKTHTFTRSDDQDFDPSNQFLVYRISPPYDSIRAMKLAGKKKKNLPKDTLGIFNLTTNEVIKIANLNKYQIPEKWGHHIAVNLEANNPDESGDLLWIDLTTGRIDTLPQVKKMVMPKENMGLIAYSEGKDSTLEAGLYQYDFEEKEFTPYFIFSGDYHQLSFNDNGDQFAFIADLDTSDAEIRPYELFYAGNAKNPSFLLGPDDNEIPDGMQLSIHEPIRWNESGTTLFFGLSPIPLLKDSTKLEDEIPEVEVWTTDDQVLYTMQEVRKSRDLKKSYLIAYDKNNNTFVPLETKTVDDVRLPEEGEADELFAIDDNLYQKSLTWLGHDYNDLYIVDEDTGNKKMVKQKINGNVSVSPAGKYAYWFDRGQQQYFAYGLQKNETIPLTSSIPFSLGDERNDRPMDAYPYGIAGWLDGDEALIIYDRYDLWKIDPKGNNSPQKLTNGRDNKIVYRYIDLDREEEYISIENALLHIFDEVSKESGYAKIMENGKLSIKIKGPYAYSRRVQKAKNANVIMYTKENFQVFPDLVFNDLSLSNETTISNANPQQTEYLWGSGELYTWKNKKGEKMTGMIYKPENFDPSMQYPMIVNFYERSSDRLHRHRAPFAGRSTISYSYYLSNGYVIFNPDVPYEIGYPGKSALAAVMSGIDAILAEGYVDPDRIGIQGHSWGGYQIAHILTKTDRFACAEAGAPVVNMTSAYGGIRWGSGMSRMFQYEKTQSRLGGTLWEKPELYLENSPLFNIDKVNTPVLILHNDEDGAVPWYQGIEYFMALRRLGKKGWLLNYNGEPHWPLKWPNRLDFQTRMEQFFNHYLKGNPIPEWMEEGVSVLEKGKTMGY